ncbi:MAG: ribonuclease Z [Parabacteroides sp.]|jgi:ribonuclease Z|nr:ribonuclease Z [Parabacteroides sp.]MBP8759600.1 ribonuclease Z [Parabacteroides sp.]MBP9578743.1 ribonuclease Z [Parabacteroides sp.]MDD2415224.1 ribonuclease Z [Parabacteroides sp.]MDD3358390.1 ribonuclease Z [Parabacteroides sp.]
MECFEVNILGCGSALPTTRHLASSQVINLRDKLYMIDCGEGTQIQMRRMRIKFSRLNHIFISHMHGDHCFGLPGLISTLGMLGRNGELVIHGPKEIETYMKPILSTFCRELPYSVRFNHITPDVSELIWEDRSVSVYSIPLKHRLPTSGFLFAEKAKEAHIIKEMTDFYKIPVKDLPSIKRGEDFITSDGERIANARLTRPATPPKKYAYCSDTAYSEKIIPIIEGVDLLYHEATFTNEDAARAKETFHSTARQAAEIARKANVKRLVIGHYSARYEELHTLKKEAEEIFPDTILGEEGLTLSV